MIVEYNDQMSHYGVHTANLDISSQLVSLRDFTEDMSGANTFLYCANDHAYIIDISIIILHGYIVSFSPGDERRSSLANNYPLC